MGREAVRAFVRLLLVVTTAGVLIAPTAAMASVDQDGRKTGSTTIDGSYAQVTGNGFSANSSQCVLYSTLSYDSTAPRQVESGIDRCNGINLDNNTSSCPGGYAFVERYNGSNYYCDNGYAITNGIAYDATTYRTGVTSTTFHGHIDGAALDQGGFGLTDHIQGYTWGEATGGSNTCPSPAKGTFDSWERYDTATGWSLVTSSTTHRSGGGMSGAPCWATISAVDSTGGFYVD